MMFYDVLWYMYLIRFDTFKKDGQESLICDILKCETCRQYISQEQDPAYVELALSSASVADTWQWKKCDNDRPGEILCRRRFTEGISSAPFLLNQYVPNDGKAVTWHWDRQDTFGIIVADILGLIVQGCVFGHMEAPLAEFCRCL